MVPAEILNKPGKLDAGEFSRMADHPVLGADLLRRLAPGSELPMIVAFEHHIKHDRSGYPKTRHAAALHPASAMTQIADVYDALRTYRPYRGSLSLATTLEIMDKGRGTEFEPLLYDRFVAMVGRPEATPAEVEGTGRGGSGGDRPQPPQAVDRQEQGE
jgi:HD-GYP domain-containing protein (c-di-GMP phosphodiesterase class II)